MGNIVLRLNGIDAADLGQSCSLPDGANWNCDGAVADRLAELTGSRDVVCDPQEAISTAGSWRRVAPMALTLARRLWRKD